MKKLLLLITLLYSGLTYAQQKIVDKSTTSGSVSYLVAEPDDSRMVFKGPGNTFNFVDLQKLSITSTSYSTFTEEERAGNIIFGRGELTNEASDLTFVTTTEAHHLDYYKTGANWPRIFVQASGGAYFGSGRFDPDNAGRDFIRLSSDLTTVTRPFNNVPDDGVDLINKNIYQVQMVPFGNNQILVKAKRTASDEEYFAWDDTNNTLTQLTDVDHTDTDEAHPTNWPLAKAYGQSVIFYYKGQLYSSDGTANGTVAIDSVALTDKQAIGGADSYALYGSEKDGDSELYLYAEGVLTKIDLNASGSSSPTDFVSNGNLMMFIADDGTGYEPYLSDGTTAGTKKLADLNPEGASMTPSGAYNQHNIIPAGDGFVFGANNGTSSQLYFTDGSNIVSLNNHVDYNGYAANAREALTATAAFVYFADQQGNIYSVAIPDNIYTANGWTNNAPVAGQSLYFNADFTFTSDLSIHSAHIPEGVTVTVPAGVTLEITSILHSKGTLNVEEGGTLFYEEPVNTLELQALVNDIDVFLAEAQTGTEPGQYPAAALTQLSDSLSKAKTVIETADNAKAVNTMADNLHTTYIDVRWQEVQQEYVYKNNLKVVVGDVKQAQIRNLLTSKKQVDYLLLGMREAHMMGIRINIFANGFNPNPEMFDYLYEQAVAHGFKIFANPAEWAGGQRIACDMFDGKFCDVKDDPAKTEKLINRVKEFASQYKCDWINAFNEDGAPGKTWSVAQFNEIYSSLYGNVNGAELIGACTWGIPAGIQALNKTNIKDYVTVATTHNLGFNHDKWDDFIAAAGDLPVWDSETNAHDKYGTGTRLEVAVAAGVDGMVFYDNWRMVNLTNGSLGGRALELRDIYSQPKVEVTSITISGDEQVAISQSTTLTATIAPENHTNKSLTWTSSDEDVATVDANGVVTGQGLGEATITATATDGSGVSGTHTITVGPLLVQSIEVAGEATMQHGASQTLTASVSPENASDASVTWSSSSETVASVNAEGVVTANAVGTVTITATANDGSGTTGSLDITIEPILITDITLSGDAEMDANSTQTLTAEVLPANASLTTLSWSSSSEVVATVNDQGEVSALSGGNVTITATATDGSEVSGTFDLTVLEVLASAYQQAFVVFPNPSYGQFEVGAPNGEKNLSYHVYNAAGQLVQAGKVPDSGKIRLAENAKGIFNLVISTTHQSFSRRLIVH
ncbi:Ig-like domain-containing protein [Marinoscillum furvescens]|uniref:Putative secreted protein (Por secretion system target) n=1 Tax=Marinoscillum furvescens DSM 4134 TaxID=1122208 RepID=A0A3D9L5F7_MARFU|nr:Ig-like domain-containing protein [Marinoscillum furvescens]REE00180.1 putative secreted protein (Por secretion system target) [Marinoscillum furvescens DSM 4134]